jgi:hypothetical protein
MVGNKISILMVTSCKRTHGCFEPSIRGKRIQGRISLSGFVTGNEICPVKIAIVDGVIIFVVPVNRDEIFKTFGWRNDDSGVIPEVKNIFKIHIPGKNGNVVTGWPTHGRYGRPFLRYRRSRQIDEDNCSNSGRF